MHTPRAIPPFVLASVVMALSGFAPACAASNDEASGSQSSDLQVADRDSAQLSYEGALDDFWTNYAGIIPAAAGLSKDVLVDDQDVVVTTGNVTTASIHPDTVTTSTKKKKKQLCTFLPQNALEHPYFFAGGSVHANAGVGVVIGADEVFDLHDMQAAAFRYHGPSFITGVEVGVTGYKGFAFGTASNVLDAWSGSFVSASFDVSLPFVKLSEGVTGFRSTSAPTITGFDVHVGFAFSLVPTDVSLGVADATWHPWDAGTDDMRFSALGHPEYKTVKAKADGGEHQMIQYGGGGPIGQAENMGAAIGYLTGLDVMSTAAIALGIAVGVAREHGWTRGTVCPNR